jgi:predicted oxidoreductase
MGTATSSSHPTSLDSTRLRRLRRILSTGYDYSWFVPTESIIEKELALAGSEQNPDLTGKNIKLTASRAAPGAPAPIEAFKQKGVDFVVRSTLRDLVAGMNEIARGPTLDLDHIQRQTSLETGKSDTATRRTRRSWRLTTRGSFGATGCAWPNHTACSTPTTAL